MQRTRSARVVVVKGLAALALALGLAASACGPQQRFCPDSGNGVCPTPYDAPVQSDVMDTAPQEKSSTYIGAGDASTDADAGAAVPGG
ncbi:MAG TPA: hypothetical protein VK989_14325 [Polyangia bacterium]|jgi:hypothetical protein|nr:hypothetical protein [Polyangia bacterium]